MLTAITGWLDREHADRRVLVVTGSPGAGKSAVLGRVVTTADPVAAAALPASDQALRATPGSVACAVHVKGKTALEVATEIARAASASLPDREEDFAPALRTALAGQGGRRFNLIVDALDEATDPEQARTIITKVILPLVETCADVGAQVITGSRRSVGEIDLLAAFGESIHQLDLDDPALFRDGDLAAYAMATLRLEGGERDGNPYADEATAWPVAARIAALSDRNFLVAGLIARAHGLHDLQAADPVMLTFTASVDAAMRQYLQRLAPIGDVPANTALTALAFAEAPGLSLELWQAAVQALGAANLTGQQLARFARSPAASFLVESSTDSDIAVFRLFHQALNDALLRARKQIAVPADDQAALTRAFTAVGEHQGWDRTSGYLLRSLPAHAAAGGMIDTLLADDAYLLHADLRRLIPLADHAISQSGRQRSRLLRLTPRAITADPPTRTALFSVTETLDDLGRSYTASSFPAPYRAVWTTAMPRTERSLLEGHADWVRVLCPFDQAGRTLLASGGGDRGVRIWDPVTGTQQAVLEGYAHSVISMCALTLADRTLLAAGSNDGGAVRIWDPATGAQHAVLEGHSGPVNALCAFTLAGRTLLAAGDDGGAVRIWDPATGAQHAVLEGHSGPVSALCAFTLAGRALLASGGGDGAVRIWNPATGTQHMILAGHTRSVNAVCTFTEAGRILLASGSGDRTMRIWDPATGTQHAVLEGHTSWLSAVCAFTEAGRTLLASGGGDRTVRIWDPATGAQRAVLRGHTGWLSAVCAFTAAGRTLLASGGNDRTVRIWDPAVDARNTLPEGHTGSVISMCAFTLAGRALLASGGDDGKVRIWDPATGAQQAVLEGHTGPVHAVCAFTLADRALLASGGDGGAVRIWDPATGARYAVLEGHIGPVNTVCAFTLAGRTLLASGGDDRTVRIWDPATRTQHTVLEGHAGSVLSVCAFTAGDRALLVSGGDGGVVRILDPATGAQHAALEGHTGQVNVVCAFPLAGRTVLASGGDDHTVRIWDPAMGTQQAILEGHTGQVRAVCAFTQDGRTLLASGDYDRIIRIWDAATAATWLIIPVHYPVGIVVHAPDVLVAAMTAGVLAIRFPAIS